MEGIKVKIYTCKRDKVFDEWNSEYLKILEAFWKFQANYIIVKLNGIFTEHLERTSYMKIEKNFTKL
jgi:hypothetical protein